MKTNPHTKPQSHEGNPSQRSAPTYSPIRVHPCPFAGQRFPLRAPAPLREMSAFSLVELLVVIAIIGMMVGLSALAVSGMRAPAVQHAADQVMSGLSLARQIAITKNTQAALLIADKTNTGFPTNGPYRHWSIVYSNRGTSGNWTIAKDWEELPNGAVFGELLGSGYNPLNVNPYALNPGGTISSAQISGNTTFTIFRDTSSTPAVITSTALPSIRFASDGSASGSAWAIRLMPGSAMSGNATITGTNQYYFVETDTRTGRIRMRSPENYKKTP
jgi:Tfp pilus assembly protein FimT